MSNAERAAKAVREFNKLVPSLTGFAKVVTGNQKIQVRPGANGMTNGKVITIRPPMALATTADHDRWQCDKRDETRTLICPACRRLEAVYVTIYHELSHITSGSLDPVSLHSLHAKAVAGAAVASKQFQQFIQNRLDAAGFNSFLSYNIYDFAKKVEPKIIYFIRAIDDIRIDRISFKARPGVKAMRDALLTRVLTLGVETGTGDFLPWSERQIEVQFPIAILTTMHGHDIEGRFDDRIIHALKLPVMRELMSREVKSNAETLGLSIAFLGIMSDLGLYGLDLPEVEDDGNPDSDNPDDAGDDTSGDPDDSGESQDPPEDQAGSETDGGSDGKGEPDAGNGNASERERLRADEDEQGSDESDSGEPVSDGDDSSGDNDPETGSDSDDSGLREPAEESDESEIGESGLDYDVPGIGGSDGGSDGPGGSFGEQEDEVIGEDGWDDFDGSESASFDGDSGDSASGSMGSDGDNGSAVPEPGPPDSSVPELDDGNGGNILGGSGNGSDSQGDHAEGSDSGEGIHETGEYDSEVSAEEYEITVDDLRDGFKHDGDMAPSSEIERGLAQGSGHEEAESVNNEGGGVSDNNIEIAISQVESFDDMSWNVGRLVIEPAGQGAATKNSPLHFGRESKAEHQPVPERLLAPSVMHARRVFSDSKLDRHMRNLRKGKVDSAALGKRGLNQQDDRVFKRRIRAEGIDFEVVIGMDISGSTDDGCIYLIKELSEALANVLHRVGVRFSVYGHTMVPDMENEDLLICTVKNPEDPWGPVQKQALAGLYATWGSLDGHNLEFYRKILDRSTAKKRMIIYFTDGEIPAQNTEEEIVIINREVAICRKRQYGVMAIGIGNDSPKNFGLDTIRIDDSSDMVTVLRELEKRITH